MTNIEIIKSEIIGNVEILLVKFTPGGMSKKLYFNATHKNIHTNEDDFLKWFYTKANDCVYIGSNYTKSYKMRISELAANKRFNLMVEALQSGNVKIINH